MTFVFYCLQVDVVHIDGPTNFKVPGYTREITLGYLTSFAYPIYESGNFILFYIIYYQSVSTTLCFSLVYEFVCKTLT